MIIDLARRRQPIRRAMPIPKIVEEPEFMVPI
jgi:hypothetical protein